MQPSQRARHRTELRREAGWGRNVKELYGTHSLYGVIQGTLRKKKSDLYKRLTWSFFPGGPVVRTLFSLLRAQVQSLVRKLVSCKQDMQSGKKERKEAHFKYEDTMY